MAIRINPEIDDETTTNGFVRSYEISDASQLTAGNLADAFMGDVVLENERFRAVIAQINKPETGPVRGGSLIDVTLTGGVDYLNSFNSTVDPATTGSAVIYTEIAPARIEAKTTATVTLTGYVGDLHTTAPAPENRIDVSTDFQVAAASDIIQLSTTFNNETSRSAWLRPADQVDWGEAQVFSEGIGYLGNTTASQYVIGSIDDFALGYYTSGTAPMEGLHQGRDSVIIAHGDAKELEAALSARRSAKDNADENLPPEFKAAGGSLEKKPGMVMFPGTETRYVPGTNLMPVPAPIYVPETSIRYVDNKPTVTLEIVSGDTVFTKPSGNLESFVELKPGQSFTFTRYLSVADSNWATIVRNAYSESDIDLGTLAGAVVEASSGEPIPDALVRISGGKDWPGAGPAAPMLQVKTRADGTFAAKVPTGKYAVQASAVGRQQLNRVEPISVAAGEPLRLTGITMSDESILRIAISEAETPTSSPLPVKVTVISKPPHPTENYGFAPNVARGIRNTLYLPQGFGVFPLTPGRYRLVISRGIEYDILEKDIALMPGQELAVTGALPHVMHGVLPGMISMDAGVVTNASAVGYASAESRAIQAACEGVHVIVSGDYGHATNLQTAIRNQGLEKWVRAFTGRRALLYKDGIAADLFVYPLDETTSASLDKALKAVADLPPDIAIADLKAQFPDLIFEISRPVHPEAGYMNSFPFNEREKQFVDNNLPPPDFNAYQILEGKKIGTDVEAYPRYIAMQMARMGTDEIYKGQAIAPVGSSFSRLPYGQEVGYPRVYMYMDKGKSAQNVTASDIVSAIRGQHFLVTNGPILLFDALNYDTLRFDVRPGDILDLGTTDVVRIRAQVLAAPWVTLYGVNTRENGLRGITVAGIQPSENVLRYPSSAGKIGSHIYTRYLDGDAILDAFAYSQIRTLEPVVPDPLADFGGQFFPFAWSGPIFVDHNADGKIVINRKEP